MVCTSKEEFREKLLSLIELERIKVYDKFFDFILTNFRRSTWLLLFDDGSVVMFKGSLDSAMHKAPIGFILDIRAENKSSIRGFKKVGDTYNIYRASRDKQGVFYREGSPAQFTVLVKFFMSSVEGLS